MTPRKASGLSRRWGMIMAMRPQGCETRARVSVLMLPAFPHTVYASLAVHDRDRSGKAGWGILHIPPKRYISVEEYQNVYVLVPSDFRVSIHVPFVTFQIV